MAETSIGCVLGQHDESWRKEQTKRKNTNNPQSVKPPSSNHHDLSHHESYFKPYNQFKTLSKFHIIHS